MSLDLLPELRTAIIGIDGVRDELAEWAGEPAVFTRRPIPENANEVYCLINPATNIGDFDALNSQRPLVDHDIAIYGRKGAPGSPEDQTRAVERAGFALRTHFHRNRFSFQPTGFSVISVVARGPIPAPTDDEQTVGRIVTLTIGLRREA
jgi:hypothetical protein